MIAEPRQDETEEEDDIVLNERFLAQVHEAVVAGDAPALHALLDDLHAADIADLIEQVGSGERAELLELMGGLDGDVLSELDEGLREEVIAQLEPEELAEAVRDLESDDVVDLIEDLESDQAAAVLGALDSADRAVVEQSLSYPEESAGRLMQREVVMAPEFWSVGDAIDFMREAEELPEQFYHVIVVDPRLRPVGYVTLGSILAAPRATPLNALYEDSFRTVEATRPEEDVAYLFNQYHLISMPVVDSDDRLVGVITIDDAMTVLDEEHEEDMMLMAGVGESSLSDTILETAQQRFGWLFVNLLTAILASAVIALFADVVDQIVALAIAMPIVASMGGNAGTQSLTVAVRAMATRDLTGANAYRVVVRETAVGFLNGLIYGVILGTVGWLWFDNAMLGLVLAVAMWLNLIVAGLAGIAIPLGLEKAGIDPALASGTLVTTVTDVVGFFCFLSLASWLLL
ncbi:magnesium transporter [Pseudoruegeria sp. SHC-113]|uniref:magnesium transporter n=1 Tax=Pseudoruegeria sp. SHC-113 TaxID=2855439 RepID=UPI0021BB0396|nr:magnesium transporter [Pseudoruegeria sp. SHC-113]MCT8161004.1 magnesium transporter [Pseudoruegeria sp. SHC-113]